MLCVAVMLSVMVLGAGAAFSDQADIENTEAVDACSALNIIGGYEDGSFHPERNIKRSEITKMICVALNAGNEPNVSTNVVPTFSDVRGTSAEWAEGYIEACVAQGIVSGVGGGRFNPDGNVTGAQLAKMLLVALGYNAETENFTGDAWETNVNVRASQKSLYKGLESLDTSAAVTRDQAAQMVWNALQAYVVEYKTNLVTDANGNLATQIVVQDKVVGGTDDKITLLYDKYDAYINIGTLVGVDKTDLTINMSPADLVSSDSDLENFSKLDTDYSGLLGQKVKVIFNSKSADKVLGVFATDDNTVYNVTANETSKDDNKVSFGGNSYSLDNVNGITTYINGAAANATTLDQLDNNELNPNAYTFVDSDANGRLDTLIVKTYNVAQVTYAASDKIIAGGNTYKYADENIADGIAKDDWVVITANLYNDNQDIVKADVQTGTLNGIRLDQDTTPYFDGVGIADPNTYNEYQIGDTWFSGGEDLVQSNASENDLNAVKPGDTVDYVSVNGVLFYVKKSTGDAVGRVADVALIVAKNDNNLRDEVKIAFFDGTTETVKVDTIYKADGTKGTFDADLTEGVVYEYSVSGGEYSFEPLKSGVGADNEKYENYYGDLTYRGALTNAALDGTDSYTTFDDMVIDNNAQVLLYDADNDTVKQISGKQFKAMAKDKIVAGNVYGFSGDMNGLDRIGALAVTVTDFNDLVKTWTNYGYIVTKPVKTGSNTIVYTIWTGKENIVVQEEKTNINERDKGTVLGFDSLTELTSAKASGNPTHLIEGAEKLEANSEFTFTAITDSNASTVQFAYKPVGADGVELDVAGTVMYIDSDASDDLQIGLAEGSIRDAQKKDGTYLANAIVIGNGDDIELLIVDQGEYLANTVYKNSVVGDNTMYGDGTGSTVEPPAEGTFRVTVTVDGTTDTTLTKDIKEGEAYSATYNAPEGKIIDSVSANGTIAADKKSATLSIASVTKAETIAITLADDEGNSGTEGNVTGATPGITEVKAGATAGDVPTVSVNYNEKDNGVEGTDEFETWLLGQLNNNADFKALVSDTLFMYDKSSKKVMNDKLEAVATITLTKVYKVSLDGTALGYGKQNDKIELPGVTKDTALISGKVPATKYTTNIISNIVTGKTEVTVGTTDLDLWTAYNLNLGTGDNAVTVTAYEVDGKKVTDGASNIDSTYYAIPGTKLWVKAAANAADDLLMLYVDDTAVTTTPVAATGSGPYASEFKDAITVDTTKLDKDGKFSVAAKLVVNLNIAGTDAGYVPFDSSANTATLPTALAATVRNKDYVQLTSTSSTAADTDVIKATIADGTVTIGDLDATGAIDGVIYLLEAAKVTFENDTTTLYDGTAAVKAAYNNTEFSTPALADVISTSGNTIYVGVGTTLTITTSATAADGKDVLVKIGDAADYVKADKDATAATDSEASVATYKVENTTALSFKVAIDDSVSPR